MPQLVSKKCSSFLRQLLVIHSCFGSAGPPSPLASLPISLDFGWRAISVEGWAWENDEGG